MWNKIFNKNKTSRSKSTSAITTLLTASSNAGTKPQTSTSVVKTPLNDDVKINKKKKKLSNVFSGLTLRRRTHKGRDRVQSDHILSILETPTHLLRYENESRDRNVHRISFVRNDPTASVMMMSMVDDDRFQIDEGHRMESFSPQGQFKQNDTLNDDDFAVVDDTPIDISLHPCPICNRTFIPSALVKHASICQKMKTKKRKVFDSSQQRREGTELASLPPQKTEQIKVPPSKTSVPNSRRASESNPSPSQERRASLPRDRTPAPPVRVIKRNLAPVTEQCPHCERFFGHKAYDRHVEWCKEKSRIGNPTNSLSLNVAKGRLEARTKYRAPPVKTKRAINREKYSGHSGDDMSVNGESPTMQKSYASGLRIDEKKNTNSMTSSTTSEGAMSDSYDPFMSAKRQLEELFPPTTTSTPTNAANKTTTNATINRTYHAPTSSSLARSFPNSNNLNTLKSTFKRTSSLRMPKTTVSLKKPNTLFLPHKPTIQRGISIDDGPISSNFLKSSEFDELPIKTACVNPSNKSVVSNTGKAYPQPPASPLKPIVMRDPSSVTRRKEMKLDLRRPHNLTGIGGGVTDLSKTDSLAVFLKYEQDLSLSPTLTEKEIKDKSNSFNKRFSTSDKSPATNTGGSERTPVTNDSAQIFIFPEPHHPPLHIDPKLINLCDNLPINITKLSDTDTNSTNSTDTDTTTTSEINRNTELLKNMLNETNSSSNRSSGIGSESSRRFKRQLKLSKDNFLYDTDVDSDQCDMIKTPTETTPTPSENNNINKTENKNNPTVKTVKNVTSTDKLFENFDLDEFISSFEDDENYPIFKDYKELFLNQNTSRSAKDKEQQDDQKNSMNNNNETEENNNHNNNTNHNNHNNSPNNTFNNSLRGNGVNTTSPKQKQIDEQNEINLLIKEIAESNLDDKTDYHTENQRRRESNVTNSPQIRNDLDEAESELRKSVQQLNMLSESTTSTMFPADSDDTSSVESDNYSISTSAKTTGSKFGADSAYGSLSRQSPIEPVRPIRRTSLQRSRQKPNFHMNDALDKLHIPKNQKREQTNSASSNEWERSLPPINDQNIEPEIMVEKRVFVTGGTGLEHKMSKFCHECGSKFLVTQAKFCMECGVRRMVLE